MPNDSTSTLLPRSRWLDLGFLAVYAALLFTRLGHYPLWDDEANTALFAQSIWRTGLPYAVMGHNVVAFRNGFELTGLFNRYLPPLPYYLDAPFAGLGGTSTFWVRLPFALLGLGTAGVILLWMHRRGAALQTRLLMMLGLLGNVSLILYERQCRYYAAALFLTVLAGFFYDQRTRERPRVLALAVCATLLLFTQYLAYGALAVALALDYGLFGRKRAPYTRRQLVALVGSQLAAAAVVLSLWNPFGRPRYGDVSESFWLDHLKIIYWNFREPNICEFFALAVLVGAPVLYLFGRKDPWLVRLPLAIAAYAVAVGVASPQPAGMVWIGDARYLSAAIPACIFLTVRFIEALPLRTAATRVLVALFLFGTNAANVAVAHVLPGSPLQPVRSTFIAYLSELKTPQESPYAAVGDWLGANLKPGQTVFTIPEWGIYPMMFHHPELVYAWQFKEDRRPELPQLPDIHFQWWQLPEYIIVFGPEIARSWPQYEAMFRQVGVRYAPVATIPVYWWDTTRPELIWHNFEPAHIQDPAREQVYVFRHASGPWHRP